MSGVCFKAFNCLWKFSIDWMVFHLPVVYMDWRVNSNLIIWIMSIVFLFCLLKPIWNNYFIFIFFFFLLLTSLHSTEVFSCHFVKLHFPHCYICPTEMLQGLTCNWYLCDPWRILMSCQMRLENHFWYMCDNSIIITTYESKVEFQCFMWL